MSGHPGYKLLLDEMWDLHCRKANSYGSDEDPLANLRNGERFGMSAWQRCLVESDSAFYRMQNYCNGRNPSTENAENALMDTAAFALLALLFLREEREKRNAEVADAQFEYEKKQKLDPDELMARAGFYKWSNGRYRLYPEVVAGSDESVANESVAEDEEQSFYEDPETERYRQQIKHDAARSGYRQPSEEIGNKMTEVLEKAK